MLSTASASVASRRDPVATRLACNLRSSAAVLATQTHRATPTAGRTASAPRVTLKASTSAPTSAPSAAAAAATVYEALAMRAVVVVGGASAGDGVVLHASACGAPRGGLPAAPPGPPSWRAGVYARTLADEWEALPREVRGAVGAIEPFDEDEDWAAVAQQYAIVSVSVDTCRALRGAFGRALAAHGGYPQLAYAVPRVPPTASLQSCGSYGHAATEVAVVGGRVVGSAAPPAGPPALPLDLLLHPAAVPVRLRGTPGAAPVAAALVVGGRRGIRAADPPVRLVISGPDGAPTEVAVRLSVAPECSEVFAAAFWRASVVALDDNTVVVVAAATPPGVTFVPFSLHCGPLCDGAEAVVHVGPVVGDAPPVAACGAAAVGSLAVDGACTTVAVLYGGMSRHELHPCGDAFIVALTATSQPSGGAPPTIRIHTVRCPPLARAGADASDGATISVAAPPRWIVGAAALPVGCTVSAHGDDHVTVDATVAIIGGATAVPHSCVMSLGKAVGYLRVALRVRSGALQDVAAGGDSTSAFVMVDTATWRTVPLWATRGEMSLSRPLVWLQHAIVPGNAACSMTEVGTCHVVTRAATECAVSGGRVQVFSFGAVASRRRAIVGALDSDSPWVRTEVD